MCLLACQCPTHCLGGPLRCVAALEQLTKGYPWVTPAGAIFLAWSAQVLRQDTATCRMLGASSIFGFCYFSIHVCGFYMIFLGFWVFSLFFQVLKGNVFFKRNSVFPVRGVTCAFARNTIVLPEKANSTVCAFPRDA
jgi:hypothetical protein